MLNFILRVLLNALAVLIVARLVPGVLVTGFWAALLAALVIGLVNALIRPVLEFLSLPITVLTLGLFTLVINAFLFWLAAALVPGFEISGFWAAFFGAIVFWLVSWATNWFLGRVR